MKLCFYVISSLAMASAVSSASLLPSMSNSNDDPPDVSVAADQATGEEATHRELFMKRRKRKKALRNALKHSKDKTTTPTTAPTPAPTEGDLQLFSGLIKTALGNIDAEELSVVECLFFEDTWIEAFNMIHGENHDSLFVRAMIVQDDESNGNDRKLQHWYSRPSTNYFDMYALIDVSCRFCGGDDFDDDKDDMWLDDDPYGWRGGYYADPWWYIDHRTLPYFQKPGKRRQLLESSADVHHRFETLLCDMLREGPFEPFHAVDNCEVTFLHS